MKETKHKIKKRNFECKVCGKAFLGSSDLNKHMRTHTDERPFMCGECHLSFRQAGTLKNHITSIHCKLNDFFACELCGRTFALKDRLKLHMRRHTGEKPYSCDCCPKKFARKSEVNQHMRVHDKKKPHTCDQCPASFTCAQNLRLHKNSHYQLKPFTCDQCGKCFSRRDALLKHLRNIHDNIKAFLCPICKKHFKGHLPQHLRTHTKTKPHICPTCKNCFAQRSQLVIHQRIHSGERPYRCRVCWKAFSHSTALKCHQRRHTGEKPFKCMICPSMFMQIPHLRNHMVRVHSMNKPYCCEWCREFFGVKRDLEEHRDGCNKKSFIKREEGNIETPMSLSKMRLLLAILLKKISTADKLNDLGFDKKLIDEVLISSIVYSGRAPCLDNRLSTALKLKNNIKILLEWTVPDKFLEKFRNEQRSIEELLEELTS